MVEEEWLRLLERVARELSDVLRTVERLRSQVALESAREAAKAGRGEGNQISS